MYYTLQLNKRILRASRTLVHSFATYKLRLLPFFANENYCRCFEFPTNLLLNPAQTDFKGLTKFISHGRNSVIAIIGNKEKQV